MQQNDDAFENENEHDRSNYFHEFHDSASPLPPRLRVKFPLDDITACVIHEALKIHRNFGPGLLESAYEMLLERALLKQGLRVTRQQLVNFTYDGIVFENGFRVDLLVEEVVVLEIKSVEHTKPVHSKQLLTYLRLMKLPVGLLLNFGEATMKEGTERIVNRLDPAHSPLLRVNQRKIAG